MSSVNLEIEIFWSLIMSKEMIVVIELPLFTIWSSVKCIKSKFFIRIECNFTVSPSTVLIVIA